MSKFNKNRSPTILLMLAAFLVFLYGCKSQNKMSLDGYAFNVPSYIEQWSGQTDENVLLTLSDPQGISIIVQNKLNVLKTTYFSRLGEEETLRSMHLLKFDSYVELFNGYDVEALQLGKIGEVSFSFQTFKYREEEVELAYDLRIVQLGNDFYAFYSFDSADRLDQMKNTIDDIIRSLSRENFEGK